MKKTVAVTQRKFVLYAMAYILIGSLVSGVPLYLQSKNYYDEIDAPANKVIKLEMTLAEEENWKRLSKADRVKLVEEYNSVVKQRNFLLLAIERVEGDSPDWSSVQCKDTVMETPVEC